MDAEPSPSGPSSRRNERGPVAVDALHEEILSLTNEAGAPRSIYQEEAERQACWAAVAEISRPQFPMTPLPAIAPMPFINLGHSVLFDYGLFANAVWGTALQMGELSRGAKARTGSSLLAAWIVGIAAAVVIAVFAYAMRFPPGLLAILSIVPIASRYLRASKVSAQEQLHRDATKLKQRVVRDLLAGRLDRLPTHPRLSGSQAVWGTGKIGDAELPVLIASKQRRFPGFGKTRLGQLFVAGEPKQGRPAEQRTLAARVFDRVAERIHRAGFAHVRVGEVVAIDGESLSANSPWLSADKAPLLWIEKRELADLRQRDPAASVRSYQAIQILFPAHQTVVTFFLRAFRVGNGASIELQAATLGPLRYRAGEVQQRILVLRQQGSATPAAGVTRRGTGPAAVLQKLRRGLDAQRRVQIHRLDLESIGALHALEQRELVEEDRLLLGRLAGWAGQQLRAPSWREQHSLPLTNDLFGAAEMRATLRSLYSSISTAALDSLADQGFDISEYRDKDGKWTIHAERIDNLMVADQIQVSTPGQARDVGAEASETADDSDAEGQEEQQSAA